MLQEPHVCLERAECVSSSSIPARLDAREAAPPPSTLGGDDEVGHPGRQRLRAEAPGTAPAPGRPPVLGRPSSSPLSLQEPGGARTHHAAQPWSADVGEVRAASGSPTLHPERLSSLRTECRRAPPPGTDEPSSCHGPLVHRDASRRVRKSLVKGLSKSLVKGLIAYFKAGVRARALSWRPSGCPIWGPPGPPSLRPERLSLLRTERHRAPPPGTDEPSSCHGSLVGGEAGPGQRAVSRRPSGSPIWGPLGSPMPRPGRLTSLRAESRPALPPGADEPSSCHGSLVGGEARTGQRAVTRRPSGSPIQEPPGSPTPRPERLPSHRTESRPAPPPGADEPSSCHGSLVGGEAGPGQRAVTRRPSGSPIWEPPGSLTLRPERLPSLRTESRPALPPGADEPGGCDGSPVGGEAGPGQRTFVWGPSGRLIPEPSGSPPIFFALGSRRGPVVVHGTS